MLRPLAGIQYFCVAVFALVLISGPASVGDEIRPGVFRTPDERFEDLSGFDYAPHYEEINGYRVHYVDEGPKGGEVVLLLHGEPSWSYLYRKMIPVIVEAGHRVIVPDLIGFGRSDKPGRREDYSAKLQVDTIEELVTRLDLQGVTLFCQDWGGLIGLVVAAKQEERFARIIAANTALPSGPGEDGTIIGQQWSEPDPEVTLDMQGGFMAWLRYSQSVPELPIGEIVQAGTVSELPPEVVAAYNAPFPDERYKAGARVMPALVMSQQATGRWAWGVYEKWEKPFLTAFSDGDPITGGGEAAFRERIPGARTQPHVTTRNAGHFLQEDKGEELGALVVKFIADNPVER